MADLFISYAREDKPRADLVARGLMEQGLDVFWDSEIPPGQTWADYIEEKLSNCAAVVVLWSANSTKSHWVREEARMGRERGKLIPAALDNSPPPFGFAEVQSADLSGWTGQPNHPDWERFIAAVKGAVARGGASPRPATGAAAPRPHTSTPPPQPQPAWSAPAGDAPKKSNRGLLIGGGIAAGVVALLAVFAVIGANMDDSESNASFDDAVQTAQSQMDAPAGGNPTPQGVMTPTAPQAQGGMPDQYRAQLTGQINEVTQLLSQQGFQPIGQPFFGGLRDDAQERIPPTNLEQGGDYRIVGVCDNDCSDLDLSLRDENNNEIATDTSTDDHPVVSSQPQWTGPFHVDVTMYQCNHAQGCYYALMLYGRPAS
ncbi:MAG: TIR domain-containing protein [Alphaproteobacteria bacterium]|nr:TIR domain-containing protein [Alphaproteobacteria bacterium]